MTCLANQINKRIETLIDAQLEINDTEVLIKQGFAQFYLAKLFAKESTLELLVCIAPAEDKAEVKEDRIVHTNYRVQIRLILSVDALEPDGGIEMLQELVRQVRISFMPKDIDDNPFKDFCTVNAQPYEINPVTYPQPEANISAISALMTLEIPFSENI